MALDPETFDALIDTVRRFVAERLRPLEAAGRGGRCDSRPMIVAEMRDLGLFGLSIAEEYGGLGLTMDEEARVAIELGPHHARLPLDLRHQCRHRQPGAGDGRHRPSRRPQWLPQHRQRRDRHQLRADRTRCRQRFGQREDARGARRRRLSPVRHQALHHQCRQGRSVHRDGAHRRRAGRRAASPPSWCRATCPACRSASPRRRWGRRAPRSPT